MTREDVTKNMAKMIEVVIRISEEDFKIMKHNVAIGKPLCSLSEPEMVSKVANGIPLPKGHTRLIAEPTKEEIKKTVGGISDFADYGRDCVKAVLDNAETIIEADTESGGEE